VKPFPELAHEMQRLVARWPDVRLVVVFGSVATGRARPDSDVDVGVLGGGFWEQLDVGSEIGRLTGHEPQVIDLAAASDWLRFEVARDGLILHEHEPGAWARFRAESAVRYFDLAPIIALCADGVRRRLARDAEG
jgi:predicted nucleotidyltransferase